MHFQFTSRILKEKGIDLYLAAAKRIHAEYPNTVFHICGGCDDPAYEEILKQAQEAGDVVYHGQQKDMIPFLKQASCIVHPSYYPEGMSNVLLEGAGQRPAYRCHRPCRLPGNSGRWSDRIPDPHSGRGSSSPCAGTVYADDARAAESHGSGRSCKNGTGIRPKNRCESVFGRDSSVGG